MKSVVKKTVVEYDPDPERIRQLMRKAGSKFGVVHFIKKGNGELRKMSYRLGVRKPKHCTAPGDGSKKASISRRDQDSTNKTMTVYDVNQVHRDKSGQVKVDENGRKLRGAYRTVPLENVIMVVVQGTRYKIQREDD